MNDLEAIADLAADAPLPLLSQLAGPRARLDAAIAAEITGAAPVTAAGTGTVARSRARRGRGSRRRLAAGGAAAAGAATAAAFAAAVALHGGTTRSGGPRAAGSVPATTSVTPVSTAPRKSEPSVATAKLTAKQVLDTAAAMALTGSPVTPRPGQYIYVKINNGDGIVQSWFSVDGRHNGLRLSAGLPPLVLPGCLPDGHYAWTGPAMPPPAALKKMTPAQRAALAAKEGGNDPSQTLPTATCTPQPAFYAGMPTTASAIAPWLARTEGAQPRSSSTRARSPTSAGTPWACTARRAARPC